MVGPVATDIWVGAEGARDMLSTLAGSMMSVMGITFSMTLLALTLASSQYTSRVLRNFMRSRVTQVTLGTCAGIFGCCRKNRIRSPMKLKAGTRYSSHWMRGPGIQCRQPRVVTIKA